MGLIRQKTGGFVHFLYWFTATKRRRHKEMRINGGSGMEGAGG